MKLNSQRFGYNKPKPIWHFLGVFGLPFHVGWHVFGWILSFHLKFNQKPTFINKVQLLLILTSITLLGEIQYYNQGFHLWDSLLNRYIINAVLTVKEGTFCFELWRHISWKGRNSSRQQRKFHLKITQPRQHRYERNRSFATNPGKII